MKKILSIILTAVLIVMSFATVSASTPPYVTSDDITVTTNMYKVTVTVEIPYDGVMTAMITNNYGENVAGKLHGAVSNRTPESIKDASGEAIAYKYVFEFKMLEGDTTNTYKACIGFRRTRTEKEFSWASIDDKISFYDTLNNKSSAEVKGYFEEKPLWVPVDLSFYKSLETTDSAVFSKVNDTIADLALSTGVTGGDTPEQKLAKLQVVDTKFTTSFAEVMEVAKIVISDEEKWANDGSKLLSTVFDDFYYNEKKSDTAVMEFADVYSKFQTEEASMGSFALAECKAAFDRATLMLIEETMSVGVLKEAFVYFANKGTITPDMTNINALINAEKDAQLWIDLAKADNADGKALVEKAESLAQTMINNGVLSDGNSSTGGTTGGTIIDKPITGGGGSLGGGGGASAPTTPTTPVVPVTPTGAFSDIASVEWAKESIEALAEMGVLNGKGDGKFAPNDSVTREEFVKIIVAAFELSEEGAECDFEDVTKDSWSYSYIAVANKLGIVSGNGTNFNPKAGISRQDMAVIIHRVFEHLGLEVSGDAINFDDNSEISEYARDAVDALTAAGIINGMGDGTFAPKGTVTRAQAAKVVYGLINLVGGGK